MFIDCYPIIIRLLHNNITCHKKSFCVYINQYVHLTALSKQRRASQAWVCLNHNSYDHIRGSSPAVWNILDCWWQWSWLSSSDSYILWHSSRTKLETLIVTQSMELAWQSLEENTRLKLKTYYCEAENRMTSKLFHSDKLKALLVQ